jgi:hypothetical protein
LETWRQILNAASGPSRRLRPADDWIASRARLISCLINSIGGRLFASIVPQGT